jgi:hypothetical protein
MVETAMRGVVREALAQSAAKGLPGAHHFYITFKTGAPGVTVPAKLAEKYPDEMTIVLEHQFWDLEVCDGHFAVTLSFNNRPERLVVPFVAITAFADPSVKFGLQFPAIEPAAENGATSEVAIEPARAKSQAELILARPAAKPASKPVEKPGEVVALDAFRKK